MAEINELEINGVVYDLGGGGGSDFDIHSLTTENAIADTDELPFYDISANASRKTTWQNIKAKLKTYFDTVYLGATALTGYATQAWVNAQGFIKSLAGYATETWVEGKGYLTEHQSLSAYRTSAAQDIIDAGKQPTGDYALRSELFSGDYDDLDNKPTIPTQLSQLSGDSTHRTVTDTEKSTWNGKQDAISDLATIRANASAGKTASDNLGGHTVGKNVPSDAIFTDTVYDDTALKGRVATIEGKESGWDAKYAKPTTGIPKSDLSNAVQTSLDKADSALQDDDLAGYATEAWVTAKGYLTEHQSLEGYVPKVFGDLNGGHTIQNSDYIAVAGSPDANAEKVNLSDFKAHINSGMLSNSGDGSNVTAAFTQATTRANIATGEKLSVLFGKIMKWFADLKTVAFTGSYTDLSNKPTIPSASSHFNEDARAVYAIDNYPIEAEYDGDGKNISATYAKKAEIPTIPTKVSAFTNDAGYLTSHQSLAEYAKTENVPKINEGSAPTEGTIDYIIYKNGKYEMPTVPTQLAQLTGDSTHRTVTDTEKSTWNGKQNKPTLVTSGTNITLANNTEYRLSNVTSLTIAYPSGAFEAWLKITTAASGTITITLPTSSYIGDAPVFANGETWELSIKDGVVVAGKAVSA